MQFISLLKSTNMKKAGLHEMTDDELLRIQNIMIDMMQDISDVCDTYGISWCLFGGSALGCVRHKGFIPWDEDMDIFMMRKDYDKFKRIFHKTLSSKYVLQEPGDDGYLFHFSRVYKKGTYIQDIQSSNDSQSGVVIDIFPMENTYKHKFMRFVHGIQCTFYLLVDSALRTERCKDNILKYCGHDEKIVKSMNRRVFLAKFFHFRSLGDWLRRSEQCFSKAKDKESKWVVAPSGSLHYWGEIYNRRKMSELRRAPFAGHQFYIMKDYNYYLKKRYGNDYMDIPPKEEREHQVFVKFDLGN